MSETKKREPLVRLMDAYGANRARWPERAHQALAALKADGLSDAEIEAAARGYEAFDRLLKNADAAQAAAPAPAALMARITAAAASHALAEDTARSLDSGEKTSLSPPPNVVDFGGKQRARQPQPIARVSLGRDAVAAGALLAASLVMGVFLGLSDVGRTTAASLGELAGVTSLQATGNPARQQTSALDSPLAIYDDEEIL